MREREIRCLSCRGELEIGARVPDKSARYARCLNCKSVYVFDNETGELTFVQRSGT